MHLATPLSLLFILTAATPSPAPIPPLDDDDTVCPERTIACGPVCVRENQRCCNDPSTADFWSCESAQSCGPSRKEGCRNPVDQQPSPSPPTSPLPSPPLGPPTITVSSTGTRTRTVHTQPTPTGADQQPPTCFFDVPLARRAPSEGKHMPCPTSLVSSLDTPAGVPTETGAAAAVPHRRWDIAALAAAAAGAVALLA
ncbi:uncharacterized protein LY79DRAFT_668153 [Colletotrichum navitas]|uniref:Extracellular membrane protein CFEM domain-containing protein n=1 Tax=Colletotrichum navitas TaxID=681940 RepID=A0AAD8V5V1_9PEZI|nr:uncharacterized protein LY79DRAFT_668153 [Colletotrichum navitas]KAK1595382.1 hypothetical protein LY79DRAFT_668153 [Colletotrichum navitas]